MTKKILSAFALLAVVAGCSSPSTREEPKAPTPTAASEPAQAAKPVTTPAAPARVQGDPFNDPANPLSKRSVYYDYDKSDIKDPYKPLVQAHAAYLAGHAGGKVVIEGNCDERGSREYNLALGQRRADAVKTAMKLLGAQDAQIETTSWGKEKPKAPGHDEAAWAENRRSDIVYRKKD